MVTETRAHQPLGQSTDVLWGPWHCLLPQQMEDPSPPRGPGKPPDRDTGVRVSVFTWPTLQPGLLNPLHMPAPRPGPHSPGTHAPGTGQEAAQPLLGKARTEGEAGRPGPGTAPGRAQAALGQHPLTQSECEAACRVHQPGRRACFLPDQPRLPRASGRSRIRCGGFMEAGWRVDTCHPNLPGPQRFPTGSSHTAEHPASQKKWPVATGQILPLKRKPLWPGIPVPGSQTETL